jgi:carbon storage regulator
MLVLSRKAEEEIRIGEHVRIRILRVNGSAVKLGIEAPPETPIVRGELFGGRSHVPAGCCGVGAEVIPR